jgi:hypothetical protein
MQNKGKQNSGPRTAAGKQRSRRNALKNGIFSRTLLPEGESHAEFESVLNDWREDLQPQGAVAAALAENLAVIYWRKLRLYRAENADIMNATEFKSFDFIRTQLLEVWKGSHEGEAAGGILEPSSNPILVQKAIVVLTSIRDNLEKVGFVEGQDHRDLIEVYGLGHDAEACLGVLRAFQILSTIAAQVRRGDKIPTSLDELKKIMIRLLDDEIARFKLAETLQGFLVKPRIQFLTTAALVPSGDAMDRFSRYESHLTREFDRILSQFDRAQRLSKGRR